MTKNNSSDDISSCDETHSFSEIARKSGTGFASRTSEHDGTAARRWLFIMPRDWTWWVWLVTACLLLVGLMGMPEAFLAALLLSIAQSVLFFARERTFKAFPVQLRFAYTLLLIICLFPPMRWIYWVPAVGTFALVIFGYCLMARMLSLLWWICCVEHFCPDPDHWIGKIMSLRPNVELAYAPLKHSWRTPSLRRATK